MTIRANPGTLMMPLAGRVAARRRISPRTAGGLRRIRRSWLSMPLPTMEEAEARMRSHPGFFASLTPAQRAFIDTWDGPEILGDPNGPKRQF